MANPLDLLTDPPQDQPVERLYVSPFKADDVPVPDVTPTNSLTQRLAPQAPDDTGTDLSSLLNRLRDYINSAPGVTHATPEATRVATGLVNQFAVQPFTAAGDVTQPNPYPEGSEEHDWYEDQRSKMTLPAALSMSQLMGGGALTEKPGVATLGSGPVRPNIGATVEQAPVFYSALEHATQSAKQDVMSPDQWQGYLKNQPGVKQEEMQWTGLGDWLKGQKGKVSKQDVQSYLDEHKVDLQDVTKSGRTEPTSAEVQGMRQKLEEAYGEGHTEGWSDQDVVDEVKAFADNPDEPLGGVKYESYQLPGGENYREHLLTMPAKPTRLEGMDWTSGGGGDAANYRSSHWDEPNVLAHVRTNDRLMPRDKPQAAAPEDKAAIQEFRTKLNELTAKHDPLQPNWLQRIENDPEIKKLKSNYDLDRLRNVEEVGDTKPVRTLHIEEIQSDWHQQGRKQGYKGDKAPEGTVAEYHEGLGWQIKDKDGKDIGVVPENDKAKNAQDAIDKWVGAGTVPDAPFRTSWPELALKRMIRHAAENGYDRISWTPGEAQAARYDLSKHYKAISTKKLPNGNYDIHGDNGTGFKMLSHDTPVEELPDFVGKELAEKIVKANGGHYEGLDLKVGGEGMREFYDKMLPKMVEKIGKAHGVKVKQGSIPSDNVRKTVDDRYTVVGDARTFDTKAEAEKIANPPVHYFDLPKSLKDQALHKGFPLFMSGVPFPLTPVDHDPFEKDKRK